MPNHIRDGPKIRANQIWTISQLTKPGVGGKMITGARFEPKRRMPMVTMFL